MEVCTHVLLLCAKVGGADGRKELPFYWGKFRSSFIGKQILLCICNREEVDRDAQLDVLRNELGEPLTSSEETPLVLHPPPEPQTEQSRSTTAVFMEILAPNQPEAPVWYSDALSPPVATSARSAMMEIPVGESDDDQSDGASSSHDFE